MPELNPEYDYIDGNYVEGALDPIEFAFTCNVPPDNSTDPTEELMGAIDVGGRENPMAGTDPSKDHRDTDATEYTPEPEQSRPTWYDRLKPDVRLAESGDAIIGQEDHYYELDDKDDTSIVEDFYSGDDEVGKKLETPEGVKPSSPDEWRASIRAALEDSAFVYDIDPEIAGGWLAAFDDGVRFVIDRFRDKGVDIGYPTIALSTRSDLFTGMAGYDVTRSVVWVNAEAMETYIRSDLDIEPYCDFHYPDGHIYFRGTALDYYSLAGVEEAHHWIGINIRGNAERTDNLSPAEHDATDMEWRALAWKIMYAKRAGMPDYSIESLIGHQSWVREYRNARKPTT